MNEFERDNIYMYIFIYYLFIYLFIYFIYLFIMHCLVFYDILRAVFCQDMQTYVKLCQDAPWLPHMSVVSETPR